MNPDSSLNINAIEAFPVEEFSAEVTVDSLSHQEVEERKKPPRKTEASTHHSQRANNSPANYFLCIFSWRHNTSYFYLKLT
jgi:hypothetical protein